MANVVTNRFLASLLTGGVNFAGASIYAVFLKSGTPTPDTNTLDELAGGIEGPRIPLAGVTVTEDDAQDAAFVDAEDIITIPLPGPATVTWLVLYQHVGADTLNTVIGAIDIPDTLLNGSSITIVWAPPSLGGMLKLVQAD